MKLKGITKKVKHTKNNAQTFEIILQFHTAKQLDNELEGQYVFWAWKRGSHAGTTLKTQVSKTGASWDDSSVNLQCSMFATTKDAKSFDSKVLEISLKEVLCFCSCIRDCVIFVVASIDCLCVYAARRAVLWFFFFVYAMLLLFTLALAARGTAVCDSFD
jgi:hypothetical protein